ncbi:hypothetical protein A3A54_00495 [Candidatus Curtissbacteria bacterium RIFCSPLOWO2_01_FULL_39_62]|uniref:Antitoxin n=2 Tax=Candidatus Curtissiibacteriota TaxID=1752717 RepID=A0A1F5G6P3_9BACT|nr:MAG: hypothetical protein A3D04_04685 [Candidatus Curtissbacteria bacterium RIFCSPHIGHO2_02_FULL_40_16b]OGE00918.1 MAG: hypothetical protein A3J17_03265 [Candidatus Curtissbacteria bacterium RIFCSPLOWO2_02_FULL_40_11]OGE02744.1 MAG: hypothetical protein A3A54_00495 [Candidatus Curtissbacteria bacterium RIFCSPLOWO2_01_FULL_39_62]OGE12089.1 MAG: hypothetical protein A3G14_00765 [Candidatus Curtissbacteria bacterium RIFCSPLOWO2_12_FULL_38_9]
MKASEVRAQWSQLLNKVFRNQTRVVVEKSGIPVAAVISAEDLQRFIQMEEQRAKRFEVLNRIGEAFKDVPEKELNRQVKKAINEVRAEKRKTSL